jgi:hypothetical protein
VQDLFSQGSRREDRTNFDERLDMVSEFAASKKKKRDQLLLADPLIFLWCPETESNRRHEDFQTPDGCFWYVSGGLPMHDFNL